ncbi:hypothetical protein CFH99_17655 [Nocardioides aromaticivorans]|uniref:Uncharacterized protein n=1 Tax=Nocardioides aromaticivorans TaxID=200618 RepID=A0ABX7PP02_9ACTN|nr:hypothetical protein [Nocardioides aromaticivorans]QSR27450.1 hypothetical protein CFH99_17655 [Nocardioides aromaticivorans]
MSGLQVTVRDRRGRWVATLSPAAVGRWLLVVGPMLAVVAAVATAAPDSPWWPAAVVGLLALGSAELPDSPAPLLTLGVAAAWWVAAVPDPTGGPVLVVAVAFLVFHTTTAYAASGPPGRTADRRVVRAVVSRTTPIGAATLAVGVLAVAAEGTDVVPGAVVVALLALAALAWLTTRQ